MIGILVSFCCVRLTYSSFENFQNNACKHFSDYATRSVNPDCYFNPDVESTTPEIIQNHGFQVESHFVTTPDGYILQLFRIPPKSEDGKKKPPIFLVHGTFADSSCYVFVGNRSLGLSLAADGYDVWLGNQRGSIYSPGHTSLKTSDEEYWNFTLDTVAANDIPACLQKVVTITGKKVIYIGHSRGTIYGFMYLVNNPKAGLIRKMIALAPAAYADPEPYFKMGVSLLQPIIESFRRSGQWAIGQDREMREGIQFLCLSYPITCGNTLVPRLVGESEQFLADDLFNVIKHVLAATSIKEILQFRQMIDNNRRLQKFDYGEIKNMETYGQSEPPVYDLSKITTPVYLFYARHDVFMSEKITIDQFNDLGSKEKGIFKIPIGIDDERSQWSHGDFVYAKDMRELLYKPLKKVIKGKLLS